MKTKGSKTKVPQSRSCRYVGLDLTGGKNWKTSFCVLEYFKHEKKLFVVEVIDRLDETQGITPDQALLKALHDCANHKTPLQIASQVSPEMPACIPCKKVLCPTAEKCSVPAVKWMRKLAKKNELAFTPYTQRPAEIWIRAHVFPKLDPAIRFDIDETLGGTRGPLTARAHYLARHLPKTTRSWIEAWPKLTLALIAQKQGIHSDPMVKPNWLHLIQTYRHLETGAHSRSTLIEWLVEHFQIFLYEKDKNKLIQSLAAFDAFCCAITAWLKDQNLCAVRSDHFPDTSSWVYYPKC